jgi:hypothetical protein
MEKTEIFCPQCAWRPQAEDRWECVPSCGTVWNTFWTRGVCPGCAVQWPATQCLACHVYSPHKAWYHAPNNGDGQAQHSDELADQAAP